MKNDTALRQHLLYLLKDGGAHATFDASVKDMPYDLQGKKPKGADHSAWQLLEHLRIAQQDILEFTRNAQHVSPEFPDGYWPKTAAPPDETAWNKSVQAFRADHKALVALVENESTDLFVPIPHGSGQTVLREVLLAADHNAYHVGQLIQVRRILGAWQ